MWEYVFLPAHDGSITFAFVYIWAALGCYKYICDQLPPSFISKKIPPGILLAIESMILEILYNGVFLLIFGSYFFYYFPANLGPFSHLSCLEVIPLYFFVGLITSRVLKNLSSKRLDKTRLVFYWMIIITFVFFI